MGLISRHAGAPIARGETSSGADLETDIANAYTLVNGNIENANVAAAADLNGAKLGSGTMANAKVADSTLTATQFAADTFSKQTNASDFNTETAIGAAWTQVETRTITTSDGPGPILLTATLVLVVPVAGYKLFRARLTRDGTDLLAGQFFMGGFTQNANNRQMSTGFWVDTAATANTTHTYALECTGVATYHFVRDFGLTCVEFR